jgi:hypothetical protein
MMDDFPSVMVYVGETDGLIIDVRNNAGGDHDKVEAVVGMFIETPMAWPLAFQADGVLFEQWPAMQPAVGQTRYARPVGAGRGTPGHPRGADRRRYQSGFRSPTRVRAGTVPLKGSRDSRTDPAWVSVPEYGEQCRPPIRHSDRGSTYPLSPLRWPNVSLKLKNSDTFS